MQTTFRRPAAVVALLSMSAASCGDPGTTTSVTNVTTLTSSTDPQNTATTTASDPTSGPPTGGQEGSSTTSSSTGTTADSDAIKYDIGSMDIGDTGQQGCEPGPSDATLEGTVVAPNLAIPVSKALVYASATMPEGVPNEVYCLECVELPCDTPYALTNADGSFSLPVASGMKYVVVQKGQFMRATPIEVVPGVNQLGVDVTSLPDHRDEANGLYIPNIALALGLHDRLEDALGKLGLADTVIDNNFYTETFVEGTQQFDLWANTDPPEYGVLGTIAELVGDYDKLSKYHILFVPCSNDPYIVEMYTPQAKENIRKWVAAGGKFYVSDWSNEYLFAGFGQYQTFHKDKDNGGTDLLTSFDSLGKVLDDDLLAWLAALPAALKDINPINGGWSDHPVIDALPQIETVDNWSGVLSTPKVLVDDGKGGQIDVGHKIWIEGPGDGYNVPLEPQPLTITGEYGCGKIMFTSYHMAEFSESYIGLTPQELVLLYLILEIGVCQKVFEPPPPPD